MSILSKIPLNFQTNKNQTGDVYANRAGFLPGRSFFEYGNKTIYFNLNNEQDYLKAFNAGGSLKSIIGRRAQYFVNGKYVVMNNNTEKPLRGQDAKDLQALLDKPNILQTGKNFKAQLNSYVDLYGYCPIIKMKSVGFPDDIATDMWCIPPWMFRATFKKSVDFWKLSKKLNTLQKDVYDKFYITWDGVETELDKESVFIILDNTLSTDSDGNLFLPDARVKGHELAVSNEVAARMAANTSITRKGPNGILSNDPGTGQYAPIKIGKEKEQVQNDFKRYGLTGQEWQVIITDASLKWQQMGSPVKDLELWNTITDAQQDLCDAIGMYPYLMAGGGKSTTFNNLSEAKKSQYQDFIIPDDDSRTEQLSEGLIPTEAKPYITVDYSHVEALQDSESIKANNMKAKADGFSAMYDLGIMTRDDMFADLGVVPNKVLPEFSQYSLEIKPPVDPNAPVDPNNPAPGKKAQK